MIVRCEHSNVPFLQKRVIYEQKRFTREFPFISHHSPLCLSARSIPAVRYLGGESLFPYQYETCRTHLPGQWAWHCDSTGDPYRYVATDFSSCVRKYEHSAFHLRQPGTRKCLSTSSCCPECCERSALYHHRHLCQYGVISTGWQT